MADEVLNRNDVEELLKTMDAGAAAGAKAKAPGTPGAGVATGGVDPLRGDAASKKAATKLRVVPYDFKRPERVGKDQMRAMQSLHEGFGRSFGASLSAMLRTIIEVKLVSVDQLTYSEFVYSLEVPTCFNLLKPRPLDGNWILDISPALLYPIIDRMLGGMASSESMMKRPLSEIELRLASRITALFLRELQNAWKNVVGLDFEVERVENNPQLVQIVPPNEVVVLVCFELSMGKTRGMANLCIPFNTIERVGQKLNNNSWVGYLTGRTSEDSKKRIAQRLDASEVDLIVNLASSTIKTPELFQLQVGDIISTEKDIREMLEVEVEGVVKFMATAGSYKGKKAIQIQEVVTLTPLAHRK
jgi:flagellar motor switch protein FliM